MENNNNIHDDARIHFELMNHHLHRQSSKSMIEVRLANLSDFGERKNFKFLASKESIVQDFALQDFGYRGMPPKLNPHRMFFSRNINSVVGSINLKNFSFYGAKLYNGYLPINEKQDENKPF